MSEKCQIECEIFHFATICMFHALQNVTREARNLIVIAPRGLRRFDDDRCSKAFREFKREQSESHLRANAANEFPVYLVKRD